MNYGLFRFDAVLTANIFLSIKRIAYIFIDYIHREIIFKYDISILLVLIIFVFIYSAIQRCRSRASYVFITLTPNLHNTKLKKQAASLFKKFDLLNRFHYNLISKLNIMPCHHWSINIKTIVQMKQGPDAISRCHLTSIGNPIVEIRRSYDRLIPTMGFPILVRRYLYIESGPRCYGRTRGVSGEYPILHKAPDL